MSETAADSRRDASPISWRWPAGVFAAATIVILTVAWPHIAASSYEIGDSAANSPVASRFALALLTALALWQGTKAVARGGYEGDPKLPDFYAS